MRVHQPDQPLDQVVHVAEGPRLTAIAVDRQWVATQRLDDEVADHPAVVGLHARAVSVEYARDLDTHPTLAVVVEEEGLGRALALVVATTWTYRVHVAPVVLGLRVYLWVAVDLAGAGLQD